MILGVGVSCLFDGTEEPGIGEVVAKRLMAYKRLAKPKNSDPIGHLGHWSPEAERNRSSSTNSGQVSPESKILILSQESSTDVVEEALKVRGTGLCCENRRWNRTARGYGSGS